MSKFFRLFMILAIFLCFGSAQTLTEPDKTVIISTVQKFLKNLQEKNLPAITAQLSKDIPIRYYSKSAMKTKIDELILNKISALDYLESVTGFNIYKMLNKFEHKTWKVLGFTATKEDIYYDKIRSKDGLINYHFAKIKIKILESEKKLETNEIKSIELNVTGEVGLVKVDGKYKVLGFIL